MTKKIQISESEKNEILGMYLTEVKIDDTSKSEIYNYLKNKNKEFISNLIGRYNSEVPSSSKTFIGSLSNLETALLQYFNAQIPNFLLMIEKEELPEDNSPFINNFINGIIQIFEKEVDEKFSGIGGWGKKQVLKSLVKDKQTLIKELSSNDKYFYEYIQEIASLVYEWNALLDFCKKSTSQFCKKFNQEYSIKYFYFFKRLYAALNRSDTKKSIINRLTTKIANKLFD
jgi:hypothetical protein